MKLTKTKLRQLIKELGDPALRDQWMTEELPSSLEEQPGYQEIHDELAPVIMRLAGLHGEDPVLGVLESFVSQLKIGF